MIVFGEHAFAQMKGFINYRVKTTEILCKRKNVEFLKKKFNAGIQLEVERKFVEVYIKRNSDGNIPSLLILYIAEESEPALHKVYKYYRPKSDKELITMSLPHQLTILNMRLRFPSNDMNTWKSRVTMKNHFDFLNTLSSTRFMNQNSQVVTDYEKLLFRLAYSAPDIVFSRFNPKNVSYPVGLINKHFISYGSTKYTSLLHNKNFLIGYINEDLWACMANVHRTDAAYELISILCTKEYLLPLMDKDGIHHKDLDDKTLTYYWEKTAMEASTIVEMNLITEYIIKGYSAIRSRFRPASFRVQLNNYLNELSVTV